MVQRARNYCSEKNSLWDEVSEDEMVVFFAEWFGIHPLPRPDAKRTAGSDPSRQPKGWDGPTTTDACNVLDYHTFNISVLINTCVYVHQIIRYM